MIPVPDEGKGFLYFEIVQIGSVFQPYSTEDVV
jgi:hypothetical protein